MVSVSRNDPARSLDEPRATSLADVLDHRAATTPDAIAYTFLEDGLSPSDGLTYRELADRVDAAAVMLRSETSPGDRVLLLYPPGLDFIVALFACFRAEVTATPAYPPGRRGSQPLDAIFADAQPAAVVTTAGLSSALPDGIRSALLPEARWARSGSIVCAATAARPPLSDSGRYALLQYTSGSTSAPKGVMVSHRNLLANSAIIRRAFDLSPASVSVSWLPAYHDMGLIDGILQPLYTGFPAYLMSPLTFLRTPARWLEAISRFRATHSGGPNFAYGLCIERTTAADRDGLDLSCWSSAYNGAEPIRAATLSEFASAFAPHGYRPHAAYPCYGLAEATLMVTGVVLGEGATIRPVATRGLSEQGVAREAGPDEPTTDLVGCGRVHGDVEVRVVHPDSGTECAPDHVGEIWVAGESITAGYRNLPKETAETFAARLADSGSGPYLRTGDLGFLHGGELFVTGRLKDLIIIRGRNHYPQDVEATVDECHRAVRAGCAAAFAVPGTDSEHLVVVCELTPQSSVETDAPAVVTAIRRAVGERHGLQVDAVALLRTGRIPKTSSGKIRRRECRDRFLSGTLGELHRSESAARRAAVRPHPWAREALATMPGERRHQWLTTYAMTVLATPHELPAVDHARAITLAELGVDSLAAAHFAHRMSAELGIAVSLTDFLDNATVGRLADRLSTLIDAAEGDDAPPRPGTLPARPDHALWPGERALWFLHTAAPADCAYNTCYAATTAHGVDVASLREALRSLSERHPALRTTYPAVEGRPRALVHEHLTMPVEEHDTTGVSSHLLGRLLAEFRDRPFDLEHGPLVRAMLCRREGGRYTVAVAAHHIVVDLWSLRTLVEDLQQVYTATTAGAAADPPPQGWTRADYLAWVTDDVLGPDGEPHWTYWTEQLEGAPTVLSLPHDRTRPAVRGSGGADVGLVVDHELATRLRALARESGVTLYTLLLAAFQVLLHRYTGSTDFLVGTPSAARTRSETAGMVGFLANQLVIRARLSDEPSFTEHLARTWTTVLGALAHQDVPFVGLVERLRPPRDPSHTPLFQVMFAFEQVPPTTGTGLPLHPVTVPATASRFDLTLVCVQDDDSLTTRWEYSTDLFDTATIRRLGRHFLTLLSDIVDDPRERIGRLRVVSEEEHRQATSDRTRPADTVDAVCLHELVAAQAARTPEAVAVVDGGGQVRYRDLDHRAELLGGHLRRHGLRPGALVAVCMPRSTDLVVAILAVLKCGAAFVPMDPSHPTRRLRHVIDDTGTPLILTRRDVLPTLPPGGPVVVCVDDPVPDTATGKAAPPEATPDDLAYVIYTSGTTGAPKGVMVSHGAVVNYLLWANRTYRMESGAGAPVSSPVTFDATITSLFGPLLVGRTVTLLGEGGEIIGLRDLLHGPVRQSLIKVTPSQLDLVRAVLPADAPPANVGALVVGGEPFSPDSLEFWRRHAPDARIFNEYGPTEATVGCCVQDASTLPSQLRSVPIGRPIPNTDIYVLDRYLRIAPIGVPGEIYIGGAGLAQGYLNRPALTAQRFVAHPFHTAHSARLYRTGDRARYLPDGRIDYLGRTDDQVKIRGVRIEPGEIEAAVLEHPDVREVAVDVSGEPGVDRQLTAYLVAEPDAGGNLEIRLRRFLGERLPAYMTPAHFVTVDALALGSHGKVDRRALRAAHPVDSASVPAHPPSTEVQRLVSTVWRDVLGLDEIRPYDNFFDLGGTSLLAAEIQARLSRTLGRRISIITLFQFPTIDSLVRSLDDPSPTDGTEGLDASATERAHRRTEALRRRTRP